MNEERKYGAIITDVGASLITQAVMEEKKITLKTVMVGDGGGAYYIPTPDMTALKNGLWSGPVSEMKVDPDSPNMIIIVAKIPASEGGFTIREMCLLDQSDNMIAIANMPEIEKVRITSGAAGELILHFRLLVSHAEILNLEIDPSIIFATKEDIEKHNNNENAHELLFKMKADIQQFLEHINDKEAHQWSGSGENNQTAINDLIQHISDPVPHVSEDEREKWNKAAQDAEKAWKAAQENAAEITELRGKIVRIEDAIFNNISANPFLVSFGDLTGIVIIKGVWNVEKQRIEC